MINIEAAYQILFPKGEMLKKLQEQCKKENCDFELILIGVFDYDEYWAFSFKNYLYHLGVHKETGEATSFSSSLDFWDKYKKMKELPRETVDSLIKQFGTIRITK